jgi:hypothetical protein
MRLADIVDGGQLLGGWLAFRVGVLITVDVLSENLEFLLTWFLLTMTVVGGLRVFSSLLSDEGTASPTWWASYWLWTRK